jgi:hypothetical protein
MAPVRVHFRNRLGMSRRIRRRKTLLSTSIRPAKVETIVIKGPRLAV